MTKDEEEEAQRAASHATEQAAEDIPCTMRPERVPDTPQDTVWEDLTDAPQDVVRADVLDTSMGGMLEAVPSNGAPERAADTMPDDVPDATEGYGRFLPGSRMDQLEQNLFRYGKRRIVGTEAGKRAESKAGAGTNGKNKKESFNKVGISRNDEPTRFLTEEEMEQLEQALPYFTRCVESLVLLICMKHILE